MNDQILVRVVDRRTNRLEQAQARVDPELMQVAVHVERNAVDVFHDEVGHTVMGCAAVEQLRNRRVVEIGEDLPLVAQAQFGCVDR